MKLYDFFIAKELYIANQVGADIQVEEPVQLTLTRKDVKDNWTLHILDGDVIVNYFYPEEKKVELVSGSILQLGDTTLRIYPDELHVVEGNVETNLTEIKKSSHVLPNEYPDYHRSPRIIKLPPEEKVTVENPPAPIQKNSQSLLKTIIPPLVMVGVSIVMALIRANALFMLMSLATTTVTVVFAVIEYFKNKKKYKHDTKERVIKYNEYYDQKVKEIYQLQRKQRENAFYHYPSPQELFKMVDQFSSRIYEKKADDFDFLTYRLGLGDVETSAKITNSSNGSIDLDDPLMAKTYKLINTHQILHDMPITTDLMHQPVGYIGPKNLVIEQLQWMLCQLATFQSYHDVRFISVFNENDFEKWAWLRWLRQFELPELKMRGFVFDQKSRDTIMNYLNQVLKDRQNELNQTNENEQKKIKFAPQFVLIVEDEQLILDHGIMEILGDEPEKLGVSLVYVKDVMSSLPENIKTVIDIRDRHTGELVMEQGKLLQKKFKLDHLTSSKQRLMPRQLASLNHLETLKSAVPEKLTFMQMYDVKSVEELHIEQRWQEHSPYKTLAAPLGVSGPDEIVDLNLHERAHGPHGLIAGTTGSGKSELIQSYILSLAVNYHPYDVAFLLIDYKGGGMANLFKDLPHLVGTITNLDKNQSLRALESINAELKKRQRLFAKYEVNHINAYQKKFKEGIAKEPMPHLFMISDEFAELKSNQPDFMDELISTARIGRSLGVHLILATQKPAGVVNDQIWSNSNFKISLKVADREDSMEVLKTPDAASITLPGRAYLEVGNNEIYELFQSAYSGAAYRPDEDEDSNQSFLIKKVDRMGQEHVISQDLSGLDQTGHVDKVPTQLEAVVGQVNKLFTESDAQPLAQPWLPPLRKRIKLSDLREIKESTGKNLKVTVGQVDIPSEQAQRSVEIDLSEDGNIGLYSASGYGKSTFLQTLVMELVRQNTPEEVNFYLLDFGTNGLMPLRNLPHVADFLALGEDEKMRKFIKRINQTMKQRQAMLGKHSVANIEMYQQMTGEIVPEIVVVVDNFDGANDSKFSEQFLNTMVKMTRDGNSLGIHLVASASAARAMHSTLINNIKRRIALKQNTDDDLYQLIGKTRLDIDDIPGRGMIVLDEPRIFQTALPVDGNDDVEIISNLRNEVDAIKDNWHGQLPDPIPMMKDQLFANDFFKRNDVQKALSDQKLPIGLDYEDVEAVVYDPEEHGNLLLMGNQAKRFKPLKMAIGDSMINGSSVWGASIIIDSGKIYSDRPNVSGFYNNDTDIKEFKDNLIEIIQDDNAKNIDKWSYIFITDMQKFVDITGILSKDLEFILKKANDAHIAIIVSADSSFITSDFTGNGNILKNYMKTMVLAMRKQDQHIVEARFDQNEIDPEIGVVWAEFERQFTKTKIIDEE
ncbi:type VII secretion protein EssC [Ligilactobacillus sp. LYQ135]